MPAVGVCEPASANAADQDTFYDFLENLRATYRNATVREIAGIEEDERRQSVRIDLELPVRITPVLVEGGRLHPQGSPIEGTTSNVSLQGLALTHSERLLDFYATVTFEPANADPVSLLVELQWTFQETNDCFRSGARFVGLLEPG
jgi:hypothetical protein